MRALHVTDDDWPMEDRLRRSRINAGYKTPAEFAIKTGISKSTICNAEAGRHTPSRLVLEKWAEVTGKTVLFLLHGEAGQGPSGGPNSASRWKPQLAELCPIAA